MNTKTEISKTHSQGSVSVICIDCKNKFTIDPGDLLLYEKIGLKIPDQCFFCRLKQYSAFWAFGKFRKGLSDLCFLRYSAPPRLAHPQQSGLLPEYPPLAAFAQDMTLITSDLYGHQRQPGIPSV